MLYRAEDKSGVGIGHRTSRLGYASSSDGISFKREKTPVFYPDNDSQSEREWPGGCEDPRVAVTNDGLFVMAYTQWNRKIFRLAIATSRDLKHWTKHGPAFSKAYNGKFYNLGCKSGSIVTEVVNNRQVIKKINGKYFMEKVYRTSGWRTFRICSWPSGIWPGRSGQTQYFQWRCRLPALGKLVPGRCCLQRPE